MTIDEVIEKFKFIAKSDTPCPRYCMLPCDKCVDGSKQLAEWLEELKVYRENSNGYNKEDIELNRNAMYNKAIDDFADKLNAKCDGMIKEKWNSNVAPISWAEAYADFKDDIDELAEQLKAGAGE